MTEVETVVACQNELGEGPVWSPDEGAIYWVDIAQSELHRHYPGSGSNESFKTEKAITALAICDRGGLVTATADGYAFWDTDTQQFDPIADPEAELEDNRFNDGAVDPRGRFWAGTMNGRDETQVHGSLYRLDADRSVHKMDSGFTVSNGTGWSPDGKTMYFTDSLHYSIYAYDFDAASGAIENRRTFAEFSGEDGVCDGLTVDSEGGVWSALWGGWRVQRFDPDGVVEREVRIPVSVASSCAFGGENLDELFVTTAWTGLSDEERAQQPGSGDLLKAHVGITGQIEPKYARGV